MKERTSIFATPKGLSDVSDFKPKAAAPARPSLDQIDQASAGGRFRSREASVDQESLEGLPSAKRKPMVYRTGRNVVFSAKTTREMVDRFYALAEAKGWKANETFERAVEALEREARSVR